MGGGGGVVRWKRSQVEDGDRWRGSQVDGGVRWMVESGGGWSQLEGGVRWMVESGGWWRVESGGGRNKMEKLVYFYLIVCRLCAHILMTNAATLYPVYH